MTRKLYIQTLLMIIINCATNLVNATLTEDYFSDIRAPKNSPYTDDMKACRDRIAEEMCDGYKDVAPTPEAIVKFIERIQVYIDKIKYNQDICNRTVSIARIAILDVAKACKMLTKATRADLLIDIRHAIDKVDRQVIELEKYVKNQS